MLQSLLHRAGDFPDALFDQRRGLADVSDGLTALVENAKIPQQPFLTVAASCRLGGRVLVGRFLHVLVLHPDAIGQSLLLAANSIQAIDDLGALLRQIRKRRGEGAQKLGVRVRAGLRFEVGDRGLHIVDGDAALGHLGLEIRDVAFIAPVLGVEIELRPGPDGGERKGRRLDLLAGPVRIGLSFIFSDRLRREWGHDRDHENGAGRNMHLRFLSRAMIRLGLRPIKPLKFTGCAALAPFGVDQARLLTGLSATA